MKKFLFWVVPIISFILIVAFYKTYEDLSKKIKKCDVVEEKGFLVKKNNGYFFDREGNSTNRYVFLNEVCLDKKNCDLKKTKMLDLNVNKEISLFTCEGKTSEYSINNKKYKVKN